MEERVLLAEDEERMRTIVRDYFQAHGVGCDLAKDGAEALELLRQRDYDAVLLDVLMPEADGFTVCRTVREHSRVPILFLTALGEERDMLRGYGLGADDYVTKPFSLAVLLAKTRALIRRSRGGGGRNAYLRSHCAPAGPPPVYRGGGDGGAGAPGLRSAALPHAQPGPGSQPGSAAGQGVGH